MLMFEGNKRLGNIGSFFFFLKRFPCSPHFPKRVLCSNVPRYACSPVCYFFQHYCQIPAEITTIACLAFVEEGGTLGNPTHSIHNIVRNTEEAVNEVLIRQIYYRPTYQTVGTHKTGNHSNAGKQTPRSPIPTRAPRATAIRRRDYNSILYIYLFIPYRAPGNANGNNHFLLHAAVHPGLRCTELAG